LQSRCSRHPVLFGTHSRRESTLTT
jgi:hypothetical protein